MVLQEKDKEILAFIDKFHCVTTTHIMKVFYPHQNQARFLTNRKMNKLIKNNLIKRDRELFNDYVYYCKKTQQQLHHLIVADLYIKFLECQGKLLDFDLEVNCSNIRPDAIVKYELNGDIYLFCFEVHLSNNKADIIKYEELYLTGKYKNYFEWFPIVIFISDKKVNYEGKLPMIIIKTDLSDFDKIFI
jgi:hypothetical protein